MIVFIYILDDTDDTDDDYDDIAKKSFQFSSRVYLPTYSIIYTLIKCSSISLLDQRGK